MKQKNMRLIDADDIGKYLFDWFERSRSYNPYDTSNTIYISDVLKIIDDMPTIEVRKVGEWLETADGYDGTYYECSVCGEPWTLIEGTPKDNNMNYCPNCGAKLEDKHE